MPKHPNTDHIIADLKTGLYSYGVISKRNDCQHATVVRIAKKHGIQHKRGEPQPYQKQTRILALARRGGITPQEIAGIVLSTPEYVQKLCIEHGLLGEQHPVTGQWYYPKAIIDVTVWSELKDPSTFTTASDRIPVFDNPITFD